MVSRPNEAPKMVNGSRKDCHEEELRGWLDCVLRQDTQPVTTAKQQDGQRDVACKRSLNFERLLQLWTTLSSHQSIGIAYSKSEDHGSLFCTLRICRFLEAIILIWATTLGATVLSLGRISSGVYAYWAYWLAELSPKFADLLTKHAMCAKPSCQRSE